ncbi:unnamed protein product [Acanthoscelides obtectus]|uniref:Uncharacterized protein n=1 Tax=Acanthoscelides obtectus TaxID=200917 RepID=A0A9P0KZL5_ACAOB|nr:unnamed protein product [Acanthoscelides obtectus]CAK1626449.1 hypothetical protein AOBTE_LOCUS3851 [Acanthoscelides obtectus]
MADIENYRSLTPLSTNTNGGVSTETYRRRILFARVSHLACDILPGDLLAKSLGNTPVEIASTILYKYFWSVLISLAESSDSCANMYSVIPSVNGAQPKARTFSTFYKKR